MINTKLFISLATANGLTLPLLDFKASTIYSSLLNLIFPDANPSVFQNNLPT